MVPNHQPVIYIYIYILNIHIIKQYSHITPYHIGYIIRISMVFPWSSAAARPPRLPGVRDGAHHIAARAEGNVGDLVGDDKNGDFPMGISMVFMA